MKYDQVFNNAKWIIVCKVLQSLLQLVVGMLCARYLGPSDYGLINYAAAIVAFAMPLMKLGLNSTLVRELVHSPEKEGEIMGTSLVMNVVSGVICMGGVALFSILANPGEKTTVWVCVLYSLSLFFAALEMIQYWFQYKLQSKYASVVMLIAYLAVSAYRIWLLVTAKSVYWFALTHSLEYGLVGITLIVLFLRKGEGRFRFSLSCAKQMFSRSKHYIVSSLMVVVFQSTDHIMITAMISKAENGFYTAAITSATVVQFVYIAIIDSFRPMILSDRKDNPAEFRVNMSRLYSIITYLALLQSLVFTLGAPWIIQLLYGSDYAASVPILRILVWFTVFSYMGSVRNVWILAEEKQKYLWIINLSGAAWNVLLNAILIPHFGACGAAAASFATQFFANFILGFIIRPIRESNRLLLRGLNPKFAIKEFRYILNLLLHKQTKPE